MCKGSLQAGVRLGYQKERLWEKMGWTWVVKPSPWWGETLTLLPAPGQRLLYPEKKAISWASLLFVLVLKRQLIGDILFVWLVFVFLFFFFFFCWLGIFWKRGAGKLSAKLQLLKNWVGDEILMNQCPLPGAGRVGEIMCVLIPAWPYASGATLGQNR